MVKKPANSGKAWMPKDVKELKELAKKHAYSGNWYQAGAFRRSNPLQGGRGRYFTKAD